MNIDAARSWQAGAGISPELLAAFGEPGFESVSVTQDELVTVRMDTRYQVVEVTLHGGKDAGDGGRAEQSGRLETAIKDAVNAALRQVMERNAAHLAGVLAHGPPTRLPARMEPPATAP